LRHVSRLLENGANLRARRVFLFYANPTARRGFSCAEPPAITPGISKQKKQTMIFNKTDCAESIAQYLERTGVWRRSLAAKFPDDVRNPRAAETLEKLSVAAADLTDSQWELLKPNYGGWNSETWRSALSQAARQVGFGFRQKRFESFVRLLLSQFSKTEIAA
jgi:hypothetical protein